MRSGWTPSIVPHAGDVTIYIVEDNFGRNGRAYRETDPEQADLETTIKDLISRQYNQPIRVVSFNTTEGWSQDVSSDIAQEIQRRHDIIGEPLPAHIQDFVDDHTAPVRQLSLRLVR